MSDQVGVRDLKAGLSAYLRRVAEGETVVVTDHGRPVARLVPPDLPERLAQLIREGRLNWTGRRLVPPRTRPKLRPGHTTLADIVLRDRG
ncbi:MAG: type II toxin-antitoxin system Phd/YefM family antitoxin [Candidatus Limnocylindria bacterium]